MKVQSVDMFVCPSATPADTSGLQALAESGKVTRDNLVAIVGKTEGTGAHDDWGRVWADVALREWTAKLLGVTADEVAKRVIFVLSGGCPGVITPHVAAALGVALALGEVPESKLSDDVVRRDWTLFSEVAMTSSGGEKRHGEVVVFGNSTASASPLRIGHAVTRDFIDAQGVRDALRVAGIGFDGGLPDAKDLDRLVHVFAKSVIPGTDQVRGRRITLLDDAHAYEIGKALGGMLIASVTGRTTNYVSGGERNSHQGPPGGDIVAAVVRA